MATNDRVLIDAILAERRDARLPSDKLDEVFELFGFEEVLKNYDLSHDELESGWVDGRNDGGIDGFFVFVNGHLVQDVGGFPWPKRNAEIRVHFVTCKHHETFAQAPLNALLASIPDLLDLGKQRAELMDRYSEDLLDARDLLYAAVRHLSVGRPTFSFHVSYVSRGDTEKVGDEVAARALQLEREIRAQFSECVATFAFVGAAELLQLYRKTKTFALELPIQEYVTRGASSYIVLATLTDYAHFVTDEVGNLRRYLFDSNVRDYLGENRVNEDIAESLRDPSAPDFWWLNNGITVLVTSASAVGKVLQLQDIQIVNGLQTTETIFHAFHGSGIVEPNRSVLLKIVVSNDDVVRDRIIRATNNQSVIETAALRATDKIQRDIEQALESHDWYYERRKNYYRNIGKPQSRFVTPMFLASGYVAIVMKDPTAAASLKSRFMRSDHSYRAVFNPDAPIGTWIVLTETLKRVEGVLETVRPGHVLESERFLARWRNLVAFVCVARVMGRFSYSREDIATLDTAALTEELVRETWEMISSLRARSPTEREYRSRSFIHRCVERAAKDFAIDHLNAVQKSTRPFINDEDILLTPELLEEVDRALPPQPWKPGVRRLVATTIGRSIPEVAAAMDELVKLGRRLEQRSGVVYDRDGNVVAVDEERTTIRPPGSTHHPDAASSPTAPAA